MFKDEKVSVIIPNYNGNDLLDKNLPFLIKAWQNPENKISEIIVVDDNSKDNSVELIKRNYPDVILIKSKKNRGFSSTVNLGVKSAKGKYVLLLNTDVEVTQNFLEQVFDLFEDKSVFGVSLHEVGFGWAKAVFSNGFICHLPGKESGVVTRTFWISGGSGIFVKSVWEKLGGMDEKLFKFYWEDIDLSYRAQKRGYKLLWTPHSKVFHNHESTMSKTYSKRKLSRIQETNQLVFIWKNLTSLPMLRKHIRGLFSRLVKHPGYAVIVLNALRKFNVIIRARRKEKKDCKVSDEAIFAGFSDL